MLEAAVACHGSAEARITGGAEHAALRGHHGEGWVLAGCGCAWLPLLVDQYVRVETRYGPADAEANVQYLLVSRAGKIWVLHTPKRGTLFACDEALFHACTYTVSK